MSYRLNSSLLSPSTSKLLSEDKTYSEIESITKASTATISRINKCLVYGADGYKRILERLAAEED